MIYKETQTLLNDNLRNATVQPRNTMPDHRPMMTCPNAGFVESHCTPENDRSGSLQSYSITCAHYVEHRDPFTGAFREGRLVHTRRPGHCGQSEICIDNLRSNWVPLHPRLAVCVRKQMFDGTMYGPDEGESMQKIDIVLEKAGYKSAYMVMSKDDGTTPTEVDTFNIDAWPEVGSMQRQKCRDCMNLETQALDSDINALKADVRLLTTGAAAGILWLALIAG